MNIAFISDLHIKTIGDEPYNHYLMFINSKKVQSCEKIVLLGDIFDFLIGEHKYFTIHYKFFFESIRDQLDRGQKVIFIEGNHDFHFESIITNYLKENTPNYGNFEYRKEGFELTLGNKIAYICHGDEVDFFNIAFKRWKRIYTSGWFKILVSYIFSFKVLLKLANLASKNSKSRGSKTFDNLVAKEKYILGAKELLELKSVEIIVAGHTHISEIKTFKNGKQYINCGYPPSSSQTILWYNEKFEFFNLRDS